MEEKNIEMEEDGMFFDRAIEKMLPSNTNCEEKIRRMLSF